MNLIEKYVLSYLKAHAGGFGAALTLLISDLADNHGKFNSNMIAGLAAAYGLVGVTVAATSNSKSDSFAPGAGLAPDATPTSDASPQDDGTND